MTTLVLKPGKATLADWRAIYRGSTPKLDDAETTDRRMLERLAGR